MSDFHTTIDERFHDWNYGHPKIIYGLIRAMKPSSIVEVGAYRGYATSWMAVAAQENGFGHVYAMDDFSITDGREDSVSHFKKNIIESGVEREVTLIIGDSKTVEWPDRVDFAYIDGCHKFESVLSDFNKSEQRGAKCICMDDTMSEIGPATVMALAKERGWNVIEIPTDCGLAICIK